jgi:hypothetical protein
MSLGRYIWTSPNSVLGLLFAPAVLAGGGGLRIVDGVLELHGRIISWLLRHCTVVPGGVSAITFGHVVLGRDSESLGQTRAHERVHVRQYETWGPAFIPAYLVASLWALVIGMDPYHGNVFEREAVVAGARWRERWLT